MASEMLRTEGLQNDLCAYNALISGCTSSRAYAPALGYFNDMVSPCPLAAVTYCMSVEAELCRVVVGEILPLTLMT